MDCFYCSSGCISIFNREGALIRISAGCFLFAKYVRGWQRTKEDYNHQNKIGDNPINLFTEE